MVDDLDSRGVILTGRRAVSPQESPHADVTGGQEGEQQPAPAPAGEATEADREHACLEAAGWRKVGSTWRR